MNNKKQLKISGFIIAIAVILVMSIIFLIAVQVPFIQNYDGYQDNHASATSKINYYNSYLDNSATVESNIASMMEEYQKKNPILYSNATKTPNEIRSILKNLKFEITSLSISTGNEDALGRTTVEGGRLFSTSINFRFSGTKEDLKKSLDYLELKADGAYYINGIDAEPYIASNSAAGTTSGEDNSVTSVATTTSKTAKYDYTVSMSLYYFEKVDLEAAVSSSQSST